MKKQPSDSSIICPKCNEYERYINTLRKRNLLLSEYFESLKEQVDNSSNKKLIDQSMQINTKLLFECVALNEEIKGVVSNKSGSQEENKTKMKISELMEKFSQKVVDINDEMAKLDFTGKDNANFNE